MFALQDLVIWEDFTRWRKPFTYPPASRTKHKFLQSPSWRWAFPKKIT